MVAFKPSPFSSSFTNSLAEDIHNFIRSSIWHTWPEGTPRSGTTWIEMLARFDTQGFRSRGSTQSKDDDAQHRFMIRSACNATRTPRPVAVSRSACVRPSLALELRTFKAIFRKVVRHHVPEGDHHLFQPPATQSDKRLRDLGINTHTAAIRGILNTSLDHRRRQPIEQALIKQRTATSANKLKHLLETNARNNDARLANPEGL